MSEQEEQREAERYQEWRAERDANEEQQYHIYLEQRIEELEAKVDRLTSRGFEDLHHENETLKQLLESVGQWRDRW